MIAVEVDYDNRSTPRRFEVSIRLTGDLDDEQLTRLEKVPWRVHCAGRSKPSSSSRSGSRGSALVTNVAEPAPAMAERSGRKQEQRGRPPRARRRGGEISRSHWLPRRNRRHHALKRCRCLGSTDRGPALGLTEADILTEFSRAKTFPRSRR
jgi:hypothetical protein